MKKLLLIILCIVFFAFPVWGAELTRYVDVDCGTPGDGTTPTCDGVGVDDPFASITVMETWLRAQSGPDTVVIYLDQDDTFTVTSTIDLGPTDNDDDVKVTLDDYEEGDSAGGARPIIDCNMNSGCTYGIIGIYGDDTIIRDVEIREGYGNCIHFSNNNPYPNDVVIERVKVDKCGASCIHPSCGAGATITKLEYSELTQCGYYENQGPECKADPHPTYPNNPAHCSGDSSWISAFGQTHSQSINLFNCTGSVARYNEIHHSYTEGVACNNSTCEYNIVGPTASSGIYCGRGGASCVIRYNLAWGSPSSSRDCPNTPTDCLLSQNFTNTPSGVNNGYWNGPGFSLDTELIGTGHTGTFVYGNIAIARSAGIRTRNVNDEASVGSVFNNEFIDNFTNFWTDIDYWTSLTVKNNISAQNSSSICENGRCYHTGLWGEGVGGGTLVASHNNWHHTPEEADYHDAGTDQVGDPDIDDSGLGVANWQSITAKSDFTTADLRLMSVSPAISAGVDLGGAEDCSDIYNLDTNCGLKMDASTDFHVLPTTATFDWVDRGDIDVEMGPWYFDADPPGPATAYYASSGGSGTLCTDIAPCTLSYACQTKAEPGDLIVIQDAISSTVDCSANDGTSGNEISIVDRKRLTGTITLGDYYDLYCGNSIGTLNEGANNRIYPCGTLYFD